MASGKSSITQTVMTCPACNVEVQATFSTDVTMESIDIGGHNGKASGAATVLVTGMRVSHDCIPKTKRSGESQTWESYGR